MRHRTHFLLVITPLQVFPERIETEGWLQIPLALERLQLLRLVELCDQPVLLDGGNPHPSAKHRILSAFPDERYESHLTIESRLESDADYPEVLTPVPFASGVIGMMSYDYAEQATLKSVQRAATDVLSLPDYRANYYSWSYTQAISDQQGYLTFSPSCSQTLRHIILEIVSTIVDTGTNTPDIASRSLDAKSPLDWTKDCERREYQAAFDAIQRYILAGDCYQVNLTQRYAASLPSTVTPLALYAQLTESTRPPFAAFFDLGNNQHVLSLSPEKFVSVQQGLIESHPIKGTALANQADPLINSAKDRAENLMIVDLIRNDLGKLCEIGSVHVPKLFVNEQHGHIQHLVSHVVGALRKDVSPMQALFECSPGGSITGAPKVRAMEIIRETEKHRRTLYCGSIFYISGEGNMDSSILIRSIAHDSGTLHCWSGGGIVVDSTLKAEYQESLDKVSHLTGITY